MSDTPLHLSYKFQRLRESIRQAVENGELENKLPGERELAKRFGVNAKTISKALTDLTSEGLLVRKVGRGTFVALRQPVAIPAVNRRQFLWLCSEQVDSAVQENFFELARQKLEEHGHQLTMHRLPTDDLGELPERCLPVSLLKHQAGLIFYSVLPSRPLLADLARRHMPVVLCNQRNRWMKLNTVMGDYSRGVFEMTEHLILQGHRRIQLVADRRQPGVIDQALRGYQTAMGRYQLEMQPLVSCSRRDCGPLREIRPAPNAIISLSGDLAVTLKRELTFFAAAHGLEQVSLMALNASGEPGPLQEAITSYDIYAEDLLDWAVQLLFESGPGVEPREIIVPGNLSDRGSTFPIAAPRIAQKVQHVIL
ncbi:MAG: hypothetical protein HJJLKODD_02503 [Phycisphaerae bacterium]|nr:hypothetical protein [Phycisphaerae bacterium]